MILDRRDLSKRMGNCTYCGKYDELRPYGAEGVSICFACGQLPDNIQETELRLSNYIDNELNRQIKNN